MSVSVHRCFLQCGLERARHVHVAALPKVHTSLVRFCTPSASFEIKIKKNHVSSTAQNVRFCKSEENRFWSEIDLWMIINQSIYGTLRGRWANSLTIETLRKQTGHMLHSPARNAPLSLTFTSRAHKPPQCAPTGHDIDPRADKHIFVYVFTLTRWNTMVISILIIARIIRVQEKC